MERQLRGGYVLMKYVAMNDKNIALMCSHSRLMDVENHEELFWKFKQDQFAKLAILLQD